MTKFVLSLLFIILVLFSAGLANDSTLIQFKIEDQFKKDHTEKEFLGKVSVFIAGDRKGIDYCDEWFGVLSDSLGRQIKDNKVIIQKMANVKGVPFFIKGIVRKKYKTNSEIILMDWKGKFLKAYDLESDVANILIFSKSGVLEFQKAVTKYDRVNFEAIINVVEKLID